MKYLYITFITLSIIACKQASSTLANKENMKTVSRDSITDIDGDSLGLIYKSNINLKSKKVATQKSRDILDYYLALPHHYFMRCGIYNGKGGKDADLVRVKALIQESGRKASIEKVNVQNGYLIASPGKAIDRNAYQLQVALFRHNNQDVVVVVNNCGAGCMCHFQDFLTLQSSGHWVKSDKALLDLPKNNGNEQSYMELPELGTTIKVKSYNDDKLLYQIKWVDGKFKIAN